MYNYGMLFLCPSQPFTRKLRILRKKAGLLASLNLPAFSPLYRDSYREGQWHLKRVNYYPEWVGMGLQLRGQLRIVDRIPF
jgi:hypothetical protein